VTERIQLSRPDGTPMRVLVVEDEDTLAQMLTMAFEYEGWAVQTAADGPGGVRAAREFKPDVVVLDVMLPGFDGLEVLARLRAEAI
jgi:two-component system, OmpR family, response regulator